MHNHVYRMYHFKIYTKISRNVQKYEKMFQTKVGFKGKLRGYYWIEFDWRQIKVTLNFLNGFP